MTPKPFVRSLPYMLGFLSVFFLYALAVIIGASR